MKLVENYGVKWNKNNIFVNCFIKSSDWLNKCWNTTNWLIRLIQENSLEMFEIEWRGDKMNETRTPLPWMKWLYFIFSWAIKLDAQYLSHTSWRQSTSMSGRSVMTQSSFKYEFFPSIFSRGLLDWNISLYPTKSK